MFTNKLLYFLLLFCFLSISEKGWSQSAGTPMSEYQQLENNFLSEEVSFIQLEAFESRAIQKLNDFANYLDYISDEHMEETFRFQAKELAIGLFTDPDLLFKYFQDGEIIETSLEKYLEKLFQESLTIKFQITDISKVSEISKAEDGSYFWFVQMLQTQKSKNLTIPSHFITFKIKLKKIEKKFGSNSKWIWKVLLDEVKSLEERP